MKRMLALALVAAGLAGFAGWNSMVSAESPATKEEKKVADALNFTMKDIDGKDVKLSDFQGKVILVVNVASKCGNTKQYTPLEALYGKYKDKGFVVLGFPANNFGGQEPGTEEDIKKGCMTKYSVTFPMFSKVSVKGEDITPLYAYLTAQETKPVGKGPVSWNFEKFLIGKDGKVAARFAPKTSPDNDTVVGAVEKALAE